MTSVYIGLGSNIPNRRQHLSAAIQEIEKSGHPILQISPVYETPALLPDLAPDEWNQPFLNAVVKIQSHQTAQQFLSILKKIEKKLGRTQNAKWSPRIIDLDILLFGGQLISTKHLCVPHTQLTHRNFTLTPLKELCPSLIVPGKKKTVLNLYRELPDKLPTWMNIVNLTPDSFSDGGEMSMENFEPLLKKLHNDNIQILDIGAESTRPGAKPVSPNVEWKRLAPFINCFFLFYKNSKLRPRLKLSVDTRYPQTAEKAIKLGADMINDVSGLNNGMLGILRSHKNIEYILTHSLNVPASFHKHLPKDKNPIEELKKWLNLKIRLLNDNHISLDRIIFDPGIGFGKTINQSLKILKHIQEFSVFPLRIMVGHSRKSFMKNFTSPESKDRDVESIGISLALAQAGADIIRVHKAYKHSKMFLGYSHAVKYSKTLP